MSAVRLLFTGLRQAVSASCSLTVSPGESRGRNLGRTKLHLLAVGKRRRQFPAFLQGIALSREKILTNVNMIAITFGLVCFVLHLHLLPLLLLLLQELELLKVKDLL